jgi:hypothetical protein
VLRTQLFTDEWKRCLTNDEGRPLEVGVQAQTSNHRKRRGLRVLVVNVAGEKPVCCSTGLRHGGGVSLIQAWVRNVGTCRPDVKGEAQVDSIHESQSTDAGHRGGAAHSRVDLSQSGS